jgi:hypothetical protein
MKEVKVTLGNLYLKEEVEKGNLEKFDYDYVKVRRTEIIYIKEYKTIDGYTNGIESKLPKELLTEEVAKSCVKSYLENKLKELE